MAITISGTNGIVGAGFTVDNSGVSVTAGVGTFSSAVIGSIGAGVSVPAAGLTGTLPTISAANCTNLPAANLTGTLPAISGANLTGITAGITMYDQWRFTASPSVNQTPLSGSWERNDTYFSAIGSGMTESSGAFTFPTSGIYQIFYQINFYTASTTNYVGAYFFYSVNSGSDFTQFAYSYDQFGSVSGTHYGCAEGNVGLNVTDASTFRVRLHASGGSPTNANVQGNSTQQTVGLTFIRIGDAG